MSKAPMFGKPLLGSAGELLNLVASCCACNAAKSDRTALKFVAGGLPESAP